MNCLLSGIPQVKAAMSMILLIIFFTFIAISIQTETNSHLFPPGSMEEFNVTGSLNTFVEQIQANSRSQEFPMGQVPVVQMPSTSQGRGSVIYYGPGIGANPAVNPAVNINGPSPINPLPPQSAPPVISGQQPVIIGPQNRPALDPALQQLLNSFNTNPAEAQRNTFIQGGGQPMLQADLNTPVVSYITCYVGCSHVTNIVTNSASVKTIVNPWNVLFLTLSTILILLF